jgi:hypothetical protein
VVYVLLLKDRSPQVQLSRAFMQCRGVAVGEAGATRSLRNGDPHLRRGGMHLFAREFGLLEGQAPGTLD